MRLTKCTFPATIYFKFEYYFFGGIYHESQHGVFPEGIASLWRSVQTLCRELNLPQTAFDILLFLANNPAYSTAADIVEIRKIKANLVSVNVDKLVRDGYLTRQAVAGDRRKTRLCCTEKAQPIIQQGRQLQEVFLERLFRGIDPVTKAAFLKTVTAMNENLDELLKGE